MQQSKHKLIKVCAKIEAELRSRKVLSVEFNKPKWQDKNAVSADATHQYTHTDTDLQVHTHGHTAQATLDLTAQAEAV